MAPTARHLVDHVIPPVPVRPWVISVPKRLRLFLAERQAARMIEPILDREEHVTAGEPIRHRFARDPTGALHGQPHAHKVPRRTRFFAARPITPGDLDTQQDSPTHGPRCSEANQHPSHACRSAIDRPIRQARRSAPVAGSDHHCQCPRPFLLAARQRQPGVISARNTGRDDDDGEPRSRPRSHREHLLFRRLHDQ